MSATLVHDLALLVKDRVRGLGFFRTAYFLPVVASFVVMATIWKFLYAESGLFNAILLTVGLPEPFGGRIGLNQLSNTIAGCQDLIIPNCGSGQKIHAAFCYFPEKR